MNNQDVLVSDDIFNADDVKSYLEHYGVLGQRKGERQYQYPDGSLTPLGRVHYGVGNARSKAKELVKGVADKSVKSVRSKVNPTKEDIEAKTAKNKQKLELQQAKIEQQKSKDEVKAAKKELKELKKKSNLKTALLDKQIDLEKTRLENNKKAQELKELRKKKLPGELNKKESLADRLDRYNNMTDKEIQDRMNRMVNQIKLSEAERRANQSLARRYIEDIAKESLKKGFTAGISKSVGDASKKYLDEYVDPDKISKRKEDKKKEETNNRIDKLIKKNEKQRLADQKRNEKILRDIEKEIDSYRDLSFNKATYKSNSSSEKKSAKKKSSKKKTSKQESRSEVINSRVPKV